LRETITYFLCLALEAAEETGIPQGAMLTDMTGLKKTVHQLILDLNKVKRMARYH